MLQIMAQIMRTLFQLMNRREPLMEVGEELCKRFGEGNGILGKTLVRASLWAKRGEGKGGCEERQARLWLSLCPNRRSEVGDDHTDDALLQAKTHTHTAFL